MTTHKVSKFRRGLNGPVYKCFVCGKMTRDTGEGEGSIVAGQGEGMCAYCYLEAGLENSLSDGTIDETKFNSEIAQLKARYNR